MGLNLINDWKNFCEGSEDFDYSHFYTLFHENANQAELIFSYLPPMEREMSMQRFTAYQKEVDNTSDHELIQLVKIDIDYKRKYCEKLGDDELVSILDTQEYVVIDKDQFKQYRKDDIPHFWMIDLIGDHLIAKRTNSKIAKALFEAYYGLTGDYQLVWFLGKPLYQDDFNPDYYFNIRKNGGDYLLGHNKVYVLNGGMIH